MSQQISQHIFLKFSPAPNRPEISRNNPSRVPLLNEKRARRQVGRIEGVSTTGEDRSRKLRRTCRRSYGVQKIQRKWEKPRLAADVSPRNDEEAFEYPLQRPVSFRSTNIGGTTFQAHQGFSVSEDPQPPSTPRPIFRVRDAS
jgi:hypothetical protein